MEVGSAITLIAEPDFIYIGESACKADYPIIEKGDKFEVLVISLAFRIKIKRISDGWISVNYYGQTNFK